MGWADRMGIACRRDREIPLGVQLEWGLRSAIARGELPAGDRLPTLRQLAEEVGANLNTIRAVYARLEHDGLIATHQGKGSFVERQPAGAQLRFTDALTRAAHAAHDAGVSPEQLAAALYVTPARELGPDPEAVARRRARAEIAVLEGALSVVYAQHPELTVAPQPGARLLGPRILNSVELRAQRDAILDQLLLARAQLGARSALEREEAATELPRRPARANSRSAAPTGSRPRIAPA